MFGELLAQALVRAVVLGDDHQARCIAIQPVNDARPALAADAGKTLTAMGDEGVDQRACPVAGSGMNDKPGGLVDDDEVIILIDHGKRDGLALRPRGDRRRDKHFDAGPRFDAMAGLHYGRPVHAHPAIGDERLKAGAAHVHKTPAQHAIEAFAGIGRADGHGEFARGFHMPGSHDRVLQDEPAPAAAGGQDPVNVRVLKWVVIVLGALLMAALVTVFGIIGYRLARPRPAIAPIEAAIGLAVRPGAEVGQFELDGNRLVVHVKHPAESELVVIDLRAGRIVSRIRLEETGGSAN